MEVYSNHQNGTMDPIGHLGFEKLAAEGLGPEDLILFYGGHPNPKVFEPSEKRKIFFSSEEAIWSRDSTDSCINEVEKILTICPPALTNRNKRELVFFPFNEDYIPPKTEKIYDCIYCGSIDNHNREIPEVISKFNYRFVGWGGDGRITNHNASYQEKINLIAQSKITICHSRTSQYTDNFPSVQCKTRYFEAAAGRSFILCKKDTYNVISHFYTAGVDFCYYTDAADLEAKIQHILDNYETFQPLIENAFNLVKENYTTRKFIERYLK